MLLVSSEHADERVVVDDACAHCTDRVRLVIEGERVAARPAGALVFRGGG